MENRIKFYHFHQKLVKREGFQSGNKDLQDYIQKLMAQNEERSISRHYVGIDSSENFVSMFSLSASTLKTENLNNSPVTFPQEIELPTIKIGRLVVDKHHIKKDIGAKTLATSIGIFIEISKKSGAIGLTVDAKKDSEDFYTKYGFQRLNRTNNADTEPMILYNSLLRKERPSLFEDPV